MWQRQSARAAVPRIPPLLRWIQQLVAEHQLPPAAVPVALDLICVMEDSLTDGTLEKRFREYSRSLLRGSVGATKAGGFLQLVMHLAAAAPPAQTVAENDCTHA